MGKLAVGLMIVVLTAMLFNVSRDTGQAKGPVVPVPCPGPSPEDVRAVADSVDQLSERIDGVASAAESISQELASVAQRIDVLETPSVVQQPTPECVCTCDCPTIDEVRTVVREELDKTVAASKPPAQSVTRTATPKTPQPTAQGPVLNPGERIVAVDGVPVNQSRPVRVGFFGSAPVRATCTAPGCR